MKSIFAILIITLMVSKLNAQIEIVAHRGDNFTAPENTLASALNAIEFGASYVEVDVRTSKDGVLYNLHDATFDRTTNGFGNIWSTPSSEINKLDAGSWFSDEFKGEQVPTIREMLVKLRNKTNIYFDVKDANVRQLVDLVREEGYANKSFFWFKDNAKLDSLIRLAPEMKYKMNASNVGRVKEILTKYRPSIIETGINDVTPELKKICHDNGIKVMIFIQGEKSTLVDIYRKAVTLAPDMLNIDSPKHFKQIQ